MDLNTFFQNFEVIADAPGGVARLREMILDLAMNGYLCPTSEKWRECRLGEVTKIRTGKLDANASSPDGVYPFFTCAKDPLRINSYSYDTECVLLAGNGNFDVNYYSGRFDAYQRTYIIEAREEQKLYVPFLFRFMQKHSRKLLSEAIGGVIKYIKIGFLTEAKFRFPQMDEQQKIVAKVDELMLLCDELESSQKARNLCRDRARDSSLDAISTAHSAEDTNSAWHRVLENWKTFSTTQVEIDSLRSLILDLAVSGKLSPVVSFTSTEKSSIDYSALKLDEEKLWELPTALSEPLPGWSRMPLAKLGRWGSGGTPTASRKEFYVNGTIPWAVIGDLNNGIMNSTEAMITESALEKSSAKLVPAGAVLVAMYGASIGKCAVAGIQCCTNQAIAHCVVDSKIISADYLFLVVKSLKRHLIEMGKGAAQPNISQTVLKHLVIDVPSLEIQQSVMELANTLLSQCDALEEVLNEKQLLAEKIATSLPEHFARAIND